MNMKILVSLALLLVANPTYADADVSITVAVGQVTVVRSPQTISTLAVGDPAVADVVAEGENAVLVFGKKPGRTDLVLMDGQHRLLRKTSVIVGLAGGDNTIIVRHGGKDGVVDDAWVCLPTCAKVKDK